MTLRKIFKPPVARRTPSATASAQLLPLPDADLVTIALEYHFSLRCLDLGCGTVHHLSVLARHLVLAQLLGEMGCREIPTRTMSRAQDVTTACDERFRTTCVIEINLEGFEALQAFLLHHDEQLRCASRGAVQAAYLKLQNIGNESTNASIAVPLAAAA